MTINELYSKIKTFPTILDFQDEIYFIENIQGLKDDDIIQNQKEFLYLLETILVSHQDNGIFEVDADNICIFKDYVSWIKGVQKKLPLSLEKYIDGFESNFDSSF